MTPAQLRTERERLGYTQAALAKVFGITRQTLINWEKGKVAFHGQIVKLALHTLDKTKPRLDHSKRG